MQQRFGCELHATGLRLRAACNPASGAHRCLAPSGSGPCSCQRPSGCRGRRACRRPARKGVACLAACARACSCCRGAAGQLACRRPTHPHQPPEHLRHPLRTTPLALPAGRTWRRERRKRPPTRSRGKARLPSRLRNTAPPSSELECAAKSTPLSLQRGGGEAGRLLLVDAWVAAVVARLRKGNPDVWGPQPPAHSAP